MIKFKSYFLFIAMTMVVVGCKKTPKTADTEKELYTAYCASCHIAPKISELPKAIWERQVLLDMATRMKIIGEYQNPNDSSGYRPEIPLLDWVRLKNYIVELAPEKLPAIKIPEAIKLRHFKEQPFALDVENGAFITYFEVLEDENMRVGTFSGALFNWNYTTNKKTPLATRPTPITDYSQVGDAAYITEVGILDPSELSKGAITYLTNTDTLLIQSDLHRPVNSLVEDLNGNGSMEVVVSEFGHETGQLSLLYVVGSQAYQKKVLLNLPGCIRTLAKDMNRDGRLDLVVMTTQGNESITILYQNEDLSFSAERVLEFSPVYGSSWFELIDYNGDGFEDLVTVNGDNADKSYVNKPYHGLRIFLNDGQNNFAEAFFYPLNGATRVVANDFDQDEDIDFAVISTFPDYQNAPERSFVFLENSDAKKFEFKTQVLENPGLGRWFLMDAGDIDSDGDDDIVLTSFTYIFTPVPKELEDQWNATNVDVLVLENTLK